MPSQIICACHVTNSKHKTLNDMVLSEIAMFKVECMSNYNVSCDVNCKVKPVNAKHYLACMSRVVCYSVFCFSFLVSFSLAQGPIRKLLSTMKSLFYYQKVMLHLILSSHLFVFVVWQKTIYYFLNFYNFLAAHKKNWQMMYPLRLDTETKDLPTSRRMAYCSRC